MVQAMISQIFYGPLSSSVFTYFSILQPEMHAYMSEYMDMRTWDITRRL